MMDCWSLTKVSALWRLVVIDFRPMITVDVASCLHQQFHLGSRSPFFTVGTYGVELPEHESHSTFILVSNLKMHEI
jgi:hypothetical protein